MTEPRGPSGSEPRGPSGRSVPVLSSHRREAFKRGQVARNGQERKADRAEGSRGEKGRTRRGKRVALGAVASWLVPGCWALGASGVAAQRAPMFILLGVLYMSTRHRPPDIFQAGFMTRLGWTRRRLMSHFGQVIPKGQDGRLSPLLVAYMDGLGGGGKL